MKINPFIYKLINFIRNISWLKSIHKIRHHVKVNNMAKHNVDGKYLIVLPHADDEYIGCDQLMKSNAECLIVNMDMAGGDTSEMHTLRYNELKEYVHSLNRRLVTIKDNKAYALQDIISKYQFDIICVPSFFDWHPEHFKVMGYLRDALIMLGTKAKDIRIAMYQVSVPLMPRYINFALPMTKEAYHNKWGVFSKYYKTQSYIPIKRFGANERINGKLLGSYAAEGYIIMTVDDWECSLDNVQKLDMESILRNNINDLAAIREHLVRFYTAASIGD